jgi:hypothetical protein
VAERIGAPDAGHRCTLEHPVRRNADLVSDWPADSLLVANAVAAGLSAAGGLVDVKSAIFTGTQTGSVAAGGSLAITDLSITHEVADASNKLIISARSSTSEQPLHFARLYLRQTVKQPTQTQTLRST